MANQHGDFVWYELLTSDADAAARFYGAVTGWQNRRAEGAAMGYRIFGTGGTDVAGFMTMPSGQDGGAMRPCWLGYVGVSDVDAIVADVVRDGGAERMPPTDIPGVGRFAMLADPQGVPFYVIRGAMDAVSTAFDPSRPGHCHWNELATREQDAALAFYGRHFGWQPGDAMPMGPMGEYRFIEHGGRTIGAVMNRQEGGPPLAWMFYFGVRDIDAAAQAVTGNGGMIHYGPAEVPGGIHIVVASDPQGALFGLVGPRTAAA